MNNEQRYNYVKTNDWENAKEFIRKGYRLTNMVALGEQIIYLLEKEISDDTPKLELN